MLKSNTLKTPKIKNTNSHPIQCKLQTIEKGTLIRNNQETKLQVLILINIKNDEL